METRFQKILDNWRHDMEAAARDAEKAEAAYREFRDITCQRLRLPLGWRAFTSLPRRS
jgi:hypothetical protein